MSAMHKFRIPIFEELDDVLALHEAKAIDMLITHELNDAKFHYSRGCKAQISALRALLIEEDKRTERD